MSRMWHKIRALVSFSTASLIWPIRWDIRAFFLPPQREHYPRHWNVTRLQASCPCPWLFRSLEEMAAFCKRMFGLRPDCDDDLIRALQKTVGFDQTQAGCRLNWELLYMDVCCE